MFLLFFFFFQAEDGIRDGHVTGVQTCALPILYPSTVSSSISYVYAFPSSSKADNLSIVSFHLFSAVTVYVSTDSLFPPSTERNSSTSIESGRSAVSSVSFHAFVISIDFSSARVFVISNLSWS